MGKLPEWGCRGVRGENGVWVRRGGHPRAREKMKRSACKITPYGRRCYQRQKDNIRRARKGRVLPTGEKVPFSRPVGSWVRVGRFSLWEKRADFPPPLPQFPPPLPPLSRKGQKSSTPADRPPRFVPSPHPNPNPSAPLRARSREKIFTLVHSGNCERCVNIQRLDSGGGLWYNGCADGGSPPHRPTEPNTAGEKNNYTGTQKGARYENTQEHKHHHYTRYR